MKLPIKTLPKFYLLKRLYIAQAICQLLMLLLSARACSKTTKQKQVNWFTMQTIWLVSVWCGDLLGGTPLEAPGFRLISGCYSFRWAQGFCRFCRNCRGCAFWRGVPNRRIGWGFCILHGVISERIKDFFSWCFWTSTSSLIFT